MDTPAAGACRGAGTQSCLFAGFTQPGALLPHPPWGWLTSRAAVGERLTSRAAVTERLPGPGHVHQVDVAGDQHLPLALAHAVVDDQLGHLVIRLAAGVVRPDSQKARHGQPRA